MNEAAVYAVNQLGDKELLVTEHLPLVKKIALHLHARLPASIELDDLLQVGMMGLLDAAGNYDPSEGASFATYSSIRIRGAILDELRRLNWVPRSLQQKAKQLAEATRTVEHRLGRSATESEIAAEMGLDSDDYHLLVRDVTQSKLLSLDEDESRVEELGNSVGDPEQSLQNAAFKRHLADVISSLPEKEQLVMSLYYDEELNLREIGEVLQVSESRVCQLHGQALGRIRSRLGDWTV